MIERVTKFCFWSFGCGVFWGDDLGNGRGLGHGFLNGDGYGCEFSNGNGWGDSGDFGFGWLIVSKNGYTSGWHDVG